MTFCRKVGKKDKKSFYSNHCYDGGCSDVVCSHSFIYHLYSAPQNSSLLASDLTSDLSSWVAPRQQRWVLFPCRWKCVDFLCRVRLGLDYRREPFTLSNAALRPVCVQCPDQGHSNAGETNCDDCVIFKVSIFCFGIVKASLAATIWLTL